MAKFDFEPDQREAPPGDSLAFLLIRPKSRQLVTVFIA
jgi:hypothetical protein